MTHSTYPINVIFCYHFSWNLKDKPRGKRKEEMLSIELHLQILNEISPEYSWKDWCWSSNTLATWCKELTHWERPWCWERVKVAGGEEDDRGWDDWMASPTWWTQFEQAGIWWWAGKPDVLQSMGLQRVGYHSETELTELTCVKAQRHKVVWPVLELKGQWFLA